MKNIILRISILRISILMALLTALFINFFLSSQYKSQSIIDVSSDEAPLVATSIVSSFMSQGGSTLSFQIKSFLESQEASMIIESKINIDEFFASDDISFFSKYKKRRNNSFHEYLSNKVKITIDSDSQAIFLETFAFRPNDALLLNLEIINMTVNYLNRTARLTSFNSKTNKVCDLYFINSDVLNSEITFLEDSELPRKVESANELLLTKALNFKDFCLENLETRSETPLQDTNLFPSFELRSINADASKKVLTEIYEESLDSFASSNNIKIIAEPITAENQENKNILLLSLLAFLCTFVTLIGIRILIRLNEEFDA